MTALRRAQVAVYLVMVIVAICLLALLGVDAFVATRAKARSQDAGDAAALAAARRQGALLNEIGRLNVRHLVAALEGDARECARIVQEQRRLALVGPVRALRDASDAASANGMKPDPGFSEILRRHVEDVRLLYAGGPDTGSDPYPEPYPGAWTEYAAALQAEADAGLAAGPDNIEFYDAAGGHLLLMRQFYDAVAGRDWCWFHFNCESLLENYADRADWGPLPRRPDNTVGNSEVFSLHLRARVCALIDVVPPSDVSRILAEWDGRRVDEEDVRRCSALSDPDQEWFFFDERWERWFDGYRLAGSDGGEFPVVGTAKPEYNVFGCAAICRCIANAPLTSSSDTDVVWSGAAKPFGAVRDGSGAPSPATSMGGFVVPCFNAVRLVPLDSVGGENLATADLAWVTHLRGHVPAYLEKGSAALSGACGYCAALRDWERPSFRREGVTWLKYNSRSCVRPVSGGSLSGGGARHGH